MTDNHLRCALAYRIELSGDSSRKFGESGDEESGVAMSDLSLSSATAVLLAKYDHASQYESGGAEGSLYGGRDKSYADAIALVIGNDPPSANGDGIGGFKVVQSEIHQVVYGVDREGLCLAVITGLKYPSRIAIQMLMELYEAFTNKFGLQFKSATPNSLTKKSKPLLSDACKKYDDLNNVDKSANLLAKVEEVKVSMQDNIAAMLVNSEQAEGLAAQSEQLNEQANVFKKKSTQLKKSMWWKNLKMTIILVVLVVGILAVILVPLIMRARNAAKDDGD